MPPLITLLTDFGTQDSYVGIMKGVIASICPSAQLIDLTHAIPPQDLAAARFNLTNAYLYFPATAIHVVVVDPGVGSPRRAIAVQTPHGNFVAPDNGVLSGVLERYDADQVQIVDLNQTEFWRTERPSHTFHGRDIFAPIAAHWAAGRLLEELGEPLALTDVVHCPLPQVVQTATGVTGCVQYCDRFGNAITNIAVDEVGADWRVEINGQAIAQHQTYSDVPPGELLALIGSYGWIEVAVSQGNAQERLGLTVGTPIQATFSKNS